MEEIAIKTNWGPNGTVKTIKLKRFRNPKESFKKGDFYINGYISLGLLEIPNRWIGSPIEYALGIGNIVKGRHKVYRPITQRKIG